MPLVGRWGADRPPMRWVGLFAGARLLATAVAVSLLVVHRVTDHDPLLVVLVSFYGTVTVGLALAAPSLLERPWLWSVDAVAVLALVLASEDWRSPFYLLMLTSLGPPAATLRPRQALLWGGTLTLGYLAVAFATRLPVSDFGTTARLETVSIHMILPLVATGGVAYTADALRRLAVERDRAERLAVEGERRRIAWELHDSAKQRLHAGTLMLSAMEPRLDGPDREMVAGALEQLRGAAADMETSIAELRTPLEGRRLDEALRDRAAELEPIGGATIRVEGDTPPLGALPATHVYRIVTEAMTNAARHADASLVAVRLGTSDGALEATVDDDGRGLPKAIRPGASGLLTMRSRAFAIGARLQIGARPGGPGTRVRLELPLDPEGEGP